MAEYKILLVDDDKDVLAALKRTLHCDTYEILTYTSAEEAMPAVGAQKIDIIVSDYKLGGMNGIDFLSGISHDYPEIINILLTGYADLNIAVDSLNKAGLYKFIVKPWDNNELRITITRALEHRRLIVENKHLLNEIKKRDLLLEQLVQEHPDRIKLKKTPAGRIIID